MPQLQLFGYTGTYYRTMRNVRRGGAVILILGDLLVFALSLWLALLLRHLAPPSEELFMAHIGPFAPLFLFWLAIYFIGGLYDTHAAIYRRELVGLIIRTQLWNVIVAALFFFAVPNIDIAPKIVLAIYLVVSSALAIFWRVIIAPRLGVRHFENALLIGEGKEFDELVTELSRGIHPIRVTHHLAPGAVGHTLTQEEILAFIERENITVVVADTRNKALETMVPVFYNLLFVKTAFRFLDMPYVYEQVFRRLPVSTLQTDWILERVPIGGTTSYDWIHRFLDIVVTLVLGIPALLAHPFVALAIKLDDRGPIFYTHARIGKNNRPVSIYKYRSMSVTERERVTRVGKWLRMSRIDELPQLWNVLKGDLSLVGPRPELPALVEEYAATIPFYRLRHLVTPGLSGWAQINDHDPPKRARVEIEKTMTKLSYDLYYLKNRSPVLDLSIALRTIRTLLSRSGS
jgi:lipopolysaccharide/colanic/teichoic acid biosynthesis glycosyltransferase